MFYYVIIFVFGGVGCLLRFAVSHGLARIGPATAFPWGTLGINMLGAFLIGFITTAGALRLNLTPLWRYALVTGLLGGFTTFSAFSLETMLMLTKGLYGLAAVYIGLSVIGTIGLAFAGLGLARLLL